MVQLIKNWRDRDEKDELILMADVDEYIREGGGIQNFCVEKDLLYAVALVNPDIDKYPTYIYGFYNSYISLNGH